MDQELIRKAAEAIFIRYTQDYKTFDFIDLDKKTQDFWLSCAEAALKVFFEHTHSQTSEGQRTNDK